ncbi:MAG: tRNA 2-thiouridine(34) synthase MnmA [Sphingomonadales bacterium]|nr:tRNA 2-thiouridine(34) synthase MnmA [Sphingomonadales bacterium]
MASPTKLPNRRCRSASRARRVVVAMSGGVDSSVAAAVLRQQGHEVIGVTLQLYDHGEAVGRRGTCCAGQDIHDARRVADKLGIPHYVLDYEQRFKATVMQAFAESYVAGETPIPCVTCNQQIKFHELLATAKDLDAEVLATGHYIELRHGPGGAELYRACDSERDQSYFLFATTRAQLASLMFPLGAMPKSQVRALARDFALPVADKSDSQDICFVPQGRYTSIVERLKPGAAEAGDIVHIDGRVLGRHDGIINYTIGQRRGLGVPGPAPLYVIRLDADRKRVVVGPRESLHVHWISLRDVNWLGDAPIPDAGLDVAARIRSSAPPQPATVFAQGREAKVLLRDGDYGIAAGQACVFYADASTRARVLGGGWIERALSRSDQPGTSASGLHAEAGEPVRMLRG